MGNNSWGSARSATGKRDWKEENRDKMKEKQRERFRKGTR